MEKRILLFCLLGMLLLSGQCFASEEGDAESKREEVENSADDKLQEIRKKTGEQFDDFTEGVMQSYDSDLFDSDTNIIEEITIKLNRTIYKFRTLIQDSIIPILFLIIGISMMCILLFWKKSNQLVGRGVLFLILGLAGVIIFTYYPYLKAYISVSN